MSPPTYSISQPTNLSTITQSDIPALSHAGLIQEPASTANTAFRASWYPVQAQPLNTPRYLHPAPVTNPRPVAVLNCPKIPSFLHVTSRTKLMLGAMLRSALYPLSHGKQLEDTKPVNHSSSQHY